MEAVASNIPAIVIGFILTVFTIGIIYFLFLRTSTTTEGMAPADYQEVLECSEEQKQDIVCHKYGNAMYDLNPEYWSQSENDNSHKSQIPCEYQEIERYSAMHGYPPESPFAVYPQDDQFHMEKLYV